MGFSTKKFKKKFKRAQKAVFTGGLSEIKDALEGPDLEKAKRKAERKELRKLTKLEQAEREEARFATTEGEGISEIANINLFLDEEDDEFLSSGETGDGLGLFI